MSNLLNYEDYCEARRPVELSCHPDHLICEGCIEHPSINNRRNVSCPICLQNTPVRQIADGANALWTAFHDYQFNQDDIDEDVEPRTVAKATVMNTLFVCSRIIFYFILLFSFDTRQIPQYRITYFIFMQLYLDWSASKSWDNKFKK